MNMKHANLCDRVVEYILTRDLDELAQLTRYRLANAFGVNKNYLSEKFKADTQRTVWEFIEFEKMKRAEKLLKTRSDLSVKDISHMVGVVKYVQFRAKFKKIYGLKPGEYRRKCSF